MMEEKDAEPRRGPAGTTDERPRWEGPPENRPKGYEPARDDPKHAPDAVEQDQGKRPDRDQS